jgi:hypothetical protein
MILTVRYRLLPSKRQHRALEALLESQRLLYNAALEERIGAYRKAGISRSYFDQTKALTEWRGDDAEARACPVQIQRATLKRLDEAYKGFFRRIGSGAKPGFPRFKGQGWVDSFGFRTFSGIAFLRSQALLWRHAGASSGAHPSADSGWPNQELHLPSRREGLDRVLQRGSDGGTDSTRRSMRRGGSRSHHVRRAIRWRSHSEPSRGASS